MEAKKEKTALHLAPCPSYDIEGLESWLGDMAQDGLILKEQGVHFGVFCFAKGIPQQMSYRLEAAMNNTIWDDACNQPECDKVLLCRDFGWEHIARYQDFDIYASADTTPRALNTDPTLHAQTLNTLKKRLICAFLFPSVVPFASLIAIYQADLLQYGLHGDTFFFCAWLLLMLHLVYCNVVEIIHLTKLRKTIQTEGELNHHKNWKANRAKHFLHIGIGWGLLIAFLGSYALLCI